MNRILAHLIVAVARPTTSAVQHRLNLNRFIRRTAHAHVRPVVLNMVAAVLRRRSPDKRIRRGVFKSVDELKQAIMDYLDNHNGHPQALASGPRLRAEIFSKVACAKRSVRHLAHCASTTRRFPTIRIRGYAARPKHRLHALAHRLQRLAAIEPKPWIAAMKLILPKSAMLRPRVLKLPRFRGHPIF